MKVEAALLEGKPLYGVRFDYAKCFDQVPHSILLPLVAQMGLPPRLTKPLEAMYSRLLRRFKVAGGVGEIFLATNGILQGCPLSVVLLNALVSVWVRAVEIEVPQASPDAFADDTGALGPDLATIQAVADVTAAFAHATKQELSVKKSFVFCTVPGVPLSVLLNGLPIKSVSDAEVLGAHLSFHGA